MKREELNLFVSKFFSDSDFYSEAVVVVDVVIDVVSVDSNVDVVVDQSLVDGSTS